MIFRKTAGCPFRLAMDFDEDPGVFIYIYIPSGYDSHSHGIDGPFIDGKWPTEIDGLPGFTY